MLYVNFEFNDLQYFYEMFADYLKMYLCLHKQESILNVAECQADTVKLVAVSSSWVLNMDRSKSKVMEFFPKKCPSPYNTSGFSLNFVESH